VLVAHATTAAAEQEQQLNKKAAAPEPAPVLDPEPMPEQPLSLAASSSSAPFASPRELHPERRGEDLFFKLGDREYRVRGLAKNTSFEALKINLRVLVENRPSGSDFHQDNVDMARAKEREHFARVAAIEISVKEEAIKRDLSRLLLKLEELQEESIRRAMQPKQPEIPGMTEAEREQALGLLRDPKLLERILADFDACGVVGEDTNKLVGYLAALSRKFDKPLGVIIQTSTSSLVRLAVILGSESKN